MSAFQECSISGEKQQQRNTENWSFLVMWGQNKQWLKLRWFTYQQSLAPLLWRHWQYTMHERAMKTGKWNCWKISTARKELKKKKKNSRRNLDSQAVCLGSMPLNIILMSFITIKAFMFARVCISCASILQMEGSSIQMNDWKSYFYLRGNMWETRCISLKELLGHTGFLEETLSSHNGTVCIWIYFCFHSITLGK